MQNFSHNDIISVYLPLKIEESYTYKVPQGLKLCAGDIVVVPLRNKEIIGIVFGEAKNINFDESKIRYVLQKASNIPSLRPELMEFLLFLAKYNLANIGAVIKMAINIAGFDFDSTQEIVSINTQNIDNLKITPKRQQVIDTLNKHNGLEKNLLIETAGVSRAIINTLIKEEFLKIDEEFKVSNFQENLNYTPVALLEEQKATVENIQSYFSSDDFKVGVLQGLPGSGKTEVYFEAVNSFLKEGKQVLILLPEIGLSTQIVDRFISRFSVEPYVWHSNITKKQKKDTFIASSNGNLKVIIGARSALFLPFNNLGLIIVDEEHDSSYKQEEGVIYNARDMAVLRAKIHNIPIMLASATPSLETLNNVEKCKYSLFKLNSRYNQMVMPDITLVDLKEQKPAKGKYLSQSMVDKIKQTLEKKEQSLLFVNKRGYASCLYCTSCGEKESCTNCSVSLSEHRSKNLLTCHFCGFSKKISNVCSSCNEEDSLISMGVGVERIFDEVFELFPQKRIAILSSDTINSHKKAIEMVEKINNYEYDILIGTQIISKGYNFPLLTFVGVVDADFSYSLDLKSSEKTWQVLYQVAGRAGRDKLQGSVMLQSYDTKNSLIESLVNKDYDQFIIGENNIRQTFNFPPFGKLIALIISSKNQLELDEFCNFLFNNKPSIENFYILGPTNAPVYLLRGFYRKRFLIKSLLSINIQKHTRQWLAKFKAPNSIKIQIDVDPISFY